MSINSYDTEISIIIVNYNGKKYIDNLMSSLKCQTFQSSRFEIVFVDNNSEDDSVKYIEKNWLCELKNLNIVRSSVNLGFAGGNNLGVYNAKGKYIVFLNNDTKPNSDWLENLYNFFVSKKGIVIANSLLLFYYDFIKIKFNTQDKFFISSKIKINETDYIIDSKFCKNLLYTQDVLTCFGHTEIYIPLINGVSDYCIEINKISGLESDVIIVGESHYLFDNDIKINISRDVVINNQKTLVQNAGSGINENYDGYDIGFTEEYCEKYAKPYKITNACGASMMIEKEKFIEIGGFDKSFFMYYEDTDLSFRAKNGGKEIWYCPDSVVRHIHTGSSKEWSPFFIYHVTKNKLLFIYKNISKKAYIKYLIYQLMDGIKSKNIYKIKGSLKTLLIKKGRNNAYNE